MLFEKKIFPIFFARTVKIIEIHAMLKMKTSLGNHCYVDGWTQYTEQVSIAVKFQICIRDYTQYNFVNNTIISITPSLHDMFRPKTVVIRYLSYAKTVLLYRMFIFHITYDCDIS
jgi:hypothetical protein